MKKITLLLFLLLNLLDVQAQISVNEGFEATSTPAGWTYVTFSRSTTTPCVATASLRQNFWSFVTTGSVTTPNYVAASNGQQINVSFDWKSTEYSAGDGVGISVDAQYSTDDGASWVTFGNVTTTSVTTCATWNGSIPTGTVPAGSDFKLRFNGTHTGGDCYFYIDSVIIAQIALTPPNCASALLPADVATGVVRNPVLSWTAATGGPTSYDVYFGTSATPGLVGNTTGLTYTPVAPLLANTTYYWQVVPKNANGSATGCAIQSFTTGSTVAYCDPTYTYGKEDGDLISNIEILTTTLSNNTGTDPVNPAYTYFTGMPNYTTVLQAGNSYNVSVTVGTFGSQNVAVWIDYNDDGNFSTSERVGYTVSSIASNGSATFQIILACNPPLGTHRMRVRDVWNTTGANISPCANYGYGETEDYDVTISAAVACPQPTGLSAANPTTNSVELSWNVGCAETAWDLHVTTVGGGAPSGAPSHPNVNDNSSFLVNTGLTPDTDYEFYVRAVCGGSNGSSLWSGPFAFSTLPFAPQCATLTTPANGATNVTLTGGGTSFAWTAPGSGPVPDSYDVYLGTAPGTLTLLGNTTNLTEIITGLDYSTTYYWQAISVNAGGSATGCVEFSFTTQAAPPPPPNDDCGAAIALTPGADFGAYDVVGTNESATDSEVVDSSIPDPACASYSGGDVWYSAVVPASGSITFEVNEISGSLTDTGGAVYSGPCSALVLEDCDDLSSASGDHPLIALTGRTPGEVLYFRVWEYGNDSTGTFSVSAYDASLSTASFNLEGFKAYPNPVKDVLNLSYTKEISKVSVHNLLGQEVLSKSVNAIQSQVDLSRLSTGTYLVKVTVDGLENTIKIVKE